MGSAAIARADDGHFKDAILADLSSRANVAQFVSFSPGGSPGVRYLCLNDFGRAGALGVEEALDALFRRAPEGSINVRSFDPNQPRSHEFIYGLTDVRDAIANVRRLAASGLYTIANETVDVADGGVSGVMYGGVIEFAPGDTPRCVEKPGTASFPAELGKQILETVYGFEPELPQPPNVRVEFSVHPLRRGVQRAHTLIWEEEWEEAVTLSPRIEWPNRFSRFLGDKAFGLLVADAVGLPVPGTTVVSRAVAPFEFGRDTGNAEIWLRTAPVEPVPGLFTTKRGWDDPFVLLAIEDPTGDSLASVLAQRGVEAEFSGAAAVTGESGEGVVVEGVRGRGDAFMLGDAGPEPLPAQVSRSVRELISRATNRLGPVRIEWVYDGQQTWVVQLHLGATSSLGQVIFPGEPTREHEFLVQDGLSALRTLVEEVQGTGEGIVVRGSVGITSHVGDLLRKARIPSRIAPTASSVVQQSRLI